MLKVTMKFLEGKQDNGVYTMTCGGMRTYCGHVKFLLDHIKKLENQSKPKTRKP